MDNWAAHKAAGDLHEQRVLHELALRGWTAHPFGQGTFPAPIQDALSRTGSALRQLPDMIAARGTDVVTIDAKTSLRSAS